MDRREVLQQRVVDLIEGSGRVGESVRRAGVKEDTFFTWRKRDPVFDRRCQLALEVGRRVRRVSEGSSAVFDPSRRLPSAPGLVRARLDYVGRPTPEHHRPVFEAWEDRTNLAVVVLGPPGSGKDTTAGDIVLLESAFN